MECVELQSTALGLQPPPGLDSPSDSVSPDDDPFVAAFVAASAVPKAEEHSGQQATEEMDAKRRKVE
jgi:hypothetical protein